MKISKQEYQPLRFLDGIDDNKHLVLIYDDPEYRKIIEYRFIENGLRKGINSIYFTHGDVRSIENEMKTYGIDVEHYKEKNLLQIIKMENITQSPEGIPKAFDNLMQGFMNDFKPPYYLTGRTILDISTETGIKAQIEVEKTIHNNFKNYQTTFLCTFHIDEIEKNMLKKWINSLLDNHHSIIYATNTTQAIGFDLTLLD
jgi:hypothetical protein